MTSEKDYGSIWSRNFGEYIGIEEEICRICGTKRRAQPWQAWLMQLDEAEKRVKYLLDTEPKKLTATGNKADDLS